LKKLFTVYSQKKETVLLPGCELVGPGGGYYEIVIPVERTEQFIFYQGELLEKYGMPVAAAGIRLARFSGGMEMEEIILRWVMRIIGVEICFAVEANNFSCSPSGTIYVRIPDARPLMLLQKRLAVIEPFIQRQSGEAIHWSRQPGIVLGRANPKRYLATALFFAHASYKEHLYLTQVRVDYVEKNVRRVLCIIPLHP
jgi:hypothetical protein